MCVNRKTNSFCRISFLADNEYHHYVEYERLITYGGEAGERLKERYPTKTDYWLAKLGHVSSRRFIDSAAHKKYDLVIGCLFNCSYIYMLTMSFSCRWPDGSACSAKDFTRLRTVFGFCYAINVI